MMITVTDPETKQKFGIDADSVFFVIHAADNPLVSLVQTKMPSPKGMVQFTVLESPADVIDMVNNAMAMKSEPSLRLVS